MPGAHGVHDAAAPALNSFTRQIPHRAEPLAAYVPATHVPHVDPNTAPCALEAVPAAQKSQRAAPVVALYCPVPHAVHVPPSAPVYPRLHVQLVAAPLAAGEWELTGHVVHVVAPMAFEYFPATHSAHTAVPLSDLYFPAIQRIHHEYHENIATPSGPVDPALQVHASAAVLATVEYEFALQEMQPDPDWSPTNEEYVDSGQLLHIWLKADPT